MTIRNWHHQHLGVTLTPTNYDQIPWRQEAGASAIERFPADASYFSRPENVWMINFRVRDLTAMVAQLRAAGLEVTADPETYPNGRLARLHEPERQACRALGASRPGQTCLLSQETYGWLGELLPENATG